MVLEKTVLLFALTAQVLAAPKPCVEFCNTLQTESSYQQRAGSYGHLQLGGTNLRSQNILDTFNRPGNWTEHNQFVTDGGHGKVYEERGQYVEGPKKVKYYKQNYSSSYSSGPGQDRYHVPVSHTDETKILNHQQSGYESRRTGHSERIEDFGEQVEQSQRGSTGSHGVWIPTGSTGPSNSYYSSNYRNYTAILSHYGLAMPTQMQNIESQIENLNEMRRQQEQLIRSGHVSTGSSQYSVQSSSTEIGNIEERIHRLMTEMERRFQEFSSAHNLQVSEMTHVPQNVHDNTSGRRQEYHETHASQQMNRQTNQQTNYRPGSNIYGTEHNVYQQSTKEYRVPVVPEETQQMRSNYQVSSQERYSNQRQAMEESQRREYLNSQQSRREEHISGGNTQHHTHDQYTAGYPSNSGHSQRHEQYWSSSERRGTYVPSDNVHKTQSGYSRYENAEDSSRHSSYGTVHHVGQSSSSQQYGMSSGHLVTGAVDQGHQHTADCDDNAQHQVQYGSRYTRLYKRGVRQSDLDDLQQNTQQISTFDLSQRKPEKLTQQTEDLTQQDEDLTQQTGGFDDFNQQTSGKLEFGQQTQQHPQQTQHSGHYTQQSEDLTQQTGGFDDLTQQTSGKLEFGQQTQQHPQDHTQDHQHSGHYTQQSEDLTQQTGGFDDLTQQTSGKLEFGQQTQQHPQQTQHSGHYTQQSEDLTQQTGGFDDLTQQTSGNLEFGQQTQQHPQDHQHSGHYTQQSEDLTQQTGGFDDLTQQTSGKLEFGQQTQQHPQHNTQEHQHSGHYTQPSEDLTQQTGGFDDFTQQTSGKLELGQQTQHSGHYSQQSEDLTQQTGGFDDDFTQQTSGNLEFGQQRQHSGHHTHHSEDLTQQTGGFDDFSQQTSGNLEFGQHSGHYTQQHSGHYNQQTQQSGHYSQQSEDLTQQTGGFDDLTQQTFGKLEYGQQTSGSHRSTKPEASGHLEFGQQSDHFGDYQVGNQEFSQQNQNLMQQTGGFRDSGRLEFGQHNQHSGHFTQETEDMKQQTGGFDDFSQQTSGHIEFGQQSQYPHNSRVPEVGNQRGPDYTQQTGNFDYSQQQSGHSGYDQYQHNRPGSPAPKPTPRTRSQRPGNYNDQVSLNNGQITRGSNPTNSDNEHGDVNVEYIRKQFEINPEVDIDDSKDEQSTRDTQNSSGYNSGNIGSTVTPSYSGVKGGRRRPNTPGYNWHLQHNPGDLTYGSQRFQNPVVRSAQVSQSNSAPPSTNSPTNSANQGDLKVEPRILEAYGGGPYDASHSDDIFTNVTPHPSATLPSYDGSDPWDIREKPRQLQPVVTVTETTVPSTMQPETTPIPETTTVSFWNKVGNKITSTFDKAKEKAKDLFG